jgi:hypothetical protein
VASQILSKTPIAETNVSEGAKTAKLFIEFSRIC